MKKFFLFIILFAATSIAYAQTRLTGRVVDTNGEGVPYASIAGKGTTIGTNSDDAGNFVLTIPANVTTIVFSSIGYRTQEVAIDGRNIINVTLEETAEKIGDLVVVAYGQQKKEAITGAVSQIKSESLAQRPVTAATSALEGQALGVQVNNSYGEPGSEASIRIRGFGSINGNNAPLYIVDGVVLGGNVGDINPNDIESISVLKDATSAALYGSRAANGVVMITTKGGKQGEERISVSADIKQGLYERAVKDYKTVNAKQFMETQWQARRNSAYTDAAAGVYNTWTDANPAALDLVKSDVGENYNIFNKSWDNLFDANGKITSGTEILSGYRNDLDWYDGLERTGWRQDYNVNAQGGSKKATYFMSVGYLDEQGFMKFSWGKRYTARANVSVQPVKWLKVGLNLSGSHQSYRSMKGSSTDNPNSYANPFYFARNMAPIYPVHLHDPATGEYVLDAFGNVQYDSGAENGRGQNINRHVTWEYELNKNKYIRNTLNADPYAEITFLKDFKFSMKGHMNNRNTTDKSYDNSTIGDGAGKGRMSKTDYRYKEYSAQELLSWKKTFADVHNVEVLAGHENYYYNYDYEYIYKQDEKFAGIMQLSNFTTFTSADGYESGYRTEGYFARANYNYNQKYFADFSIRRDGSSRFAKGHKWGTFWSVGASWMITREEFMKSYEWVNSLKLRAAYGQVGQEAGLGYYAWMALYGSTQNGGNGAYYKTQNDASSITWERVNSFSVALEGRVLNRINFSLEYFNKTSDKLLFSLNLPGSVGSTGSDVWNPKQNVNFGKVSNRGWEIGVDGDIIKNRDWTWNVGVNLNFLTNKIKELPKEYSDGYISGTKRRVVGHSIYDFWMYKYQGVDMSNGRALYAFDDEKYYITDAGYTGSAADKGANETRTLLSDNYTVINGVAYAYKTTYGKKDWSGSAIPDCYGSVNTSLKWRDLTLSILCTFQWGGKMLDYSYQSLMAIGTSPAAYHQDILNSWTPENNLGTGISREVLPALNTTQSSDNNATSDRFLQSSDYFTIKNITLSYNLPQTFVKKIGLQGVVVSAGVDNLAIFTKLRGMNPQQSWDGLNDNGYVPARVATLGLNVKF